MRVGDYCKHGVVTIDAGADVTEAARLMRNEHVGFLVVTKQGDDKRAPVGVLTDRDIVLEVCARDVDPHAVTVGDVMTSEPLVARESDDLNDVLQAMRIDGIRRVPVLTTAGALTGVIALDDALDLVAELLCDMSGSIRNEQKQERRMRSA